jgi:hypothetical protein
MVIRHGAVLAAFVAVLWYAAPTAHAGSAVLYENPAGAPILATGGTVAWSFEDAGQSGPEVHARIEVPDRATAFDIAITRNNDASLPALFIVEVRAERDDVASIAPLVAKKDEPTPGRALPGATVKVKDGVFWIALSSDGTDQALVLNLLRSSTWLALPYVTNDGRNATLTFEKGADGDNAFREAFAAWDHSVTRLAEFTGDQCDVLVTPPAADTGISVSVCRGDFEGQRLALVRLAGVMVLGDDVRFADAVRGIDEPRVIVSLSGPGGSLDAGLKIGQVIRARGFETIATPRELCLSMCAIAWLAGEPRLASVSSFIGFHAPWYGDESDRKVSAVGSALVGAFLRDLGFSDAAIVFVTNTDPSDVSYLSFEQATDLDIRIVRAD